MRSSLFRYLIIIRVMWCLGSIDYGLAGIGQWQFLICLQTLELQILISHYTSTNHSSLASYGILMVH